MELRSGWRVYVLTGCIPEGGSRHIVCGVLGVELRSFQDGGRELM